MLEFVRAMTRICPIVRASRSPLGLAARGGRILRMAAAGEGHRWEAARVRRAICEGLISRS